jgi:hypothetical protein
MLFFFLDLATVAEIDDIRLLRLYEEELADLHETIRSHLNADGGIDVDQDQPVLLQELMDYYIFDRPSFSCKGRMVDCADLALLEKSDLATDHNFLTAVFRRLGQRMLKAYDSHCVEYTSSLNIHSDSKFYFLNLFAF